MPIEFQIPNEEIINNSDNQTTDQEFIEHAIVKAYEERSNDNYVPIERYIPTSARLIEISDKLEEARNNYNQAA